MIDKVGTHRHNRSFQSGQVEPTYSLSYPRVPSAHTPPLVSVRSEGPVSARRGLDTRKLTSNVLKPPLQVTCTKDTHEVDDLSEESGGEDELIVRIDSPSKLSFNQAS